MPGLLPWKEKEMHKYLQNTLRSIIWFKKASDSGELDSKPPFQRNPVWTNRQKSSLIETVLCEYPIPELYMQEITSSSGEQKQIIVDGQQRINSVLGFLNSEYILENVQSKWEGLSFDDLGDDDKKKIYEYSFVVRLLPDISEPELREIFQRINRNSVSLNLQELRHATYWGPFIKLMEEIADFEMWDSIGIYSANDRRRMLDIEFISELTIAYLNGIQNKKRKLEEYYQIYEVEFPYVEKVRTAFVIILEEIMRVLPEIGKTRWKKKSDFYSLFLVFAANESMLPLGSEKKAIANNILMKYSQEIDAYINRDEGFVNSEPRSSVVYYVEATEKAASDLGSRKQRDVYLKNELKTVFE